MRHRPVQAFIASVPAYVRTLVSGQWPFHGQNDSSRLIHCSQSQSVSQSVGPAVSGHFAPFEVLPSRRFAPWTSFTPSVRYRCRTQSSSEQNV